jgi:toxin ParE1/3/4
VAEVRITPAAKAHLRDIWAYTDATWGESQADAYLMEIDTIFQQLAGNPQLGKARPEIRDGYRSIPVKSHVVFYTVTRNKDFVNIIGVLHARMDVESYL